jgi:hypothetical protein
MNSLLFIIILLVRLVPDDRLAGSRNNRAAPTPPERERFGS